MNSQSFMLPGMAPPIHMGYYNSMPTMNNQGLYHHHHQLPNIMDINPMHAGLGPLGSPPLISPTSSPATLSNSLPPLSLPSHQSSLSLQHQQQQHQHHQLQQQQQQHHHQQQQQQHHHQQQQHAQQLHQQAQQHAQQQAHQQQQQQHHQQQAHQQQQIQNMSSPPQQQTTLSAILSQSISQIPSSSDSLPSPVYDLNEQTLLQGNAGMANTGVDEAAAGNSQLTSPKVKSKKGGSSSSSSSKKKGSPLEGSLNSLTKEQLVALCSQYFQTMHPDLQQEFENAMPPPDLTEYTQELDSLQKKYNKLFPNNKFVFDNNSYNRVKSGLNNFKKQLVENGEEFKEKSAWSTLLQYVVQALPYVVRMPQWDDEKNNQSRQAALAKMDLFGKAAVRGLMLNDTSLEKWERYRVSLMQHANHLTTTIEELNKSIERAKKKEAKLEKSIKKRKVRM
ncbi:hypothetical protein SAMD00019534_086320 [Acytostelium subglobosum LB1]|uniref:hypothetical protein n=1 Tax=Acytostelium subglobosum LB1 TaxID=1410327 RepID=UPI000644BFEB|nr:hypothetical protein SAMD00019534_086320 [Acytostelium subglobosum LB1]GAM25457.1 hypothetical protein SAMD00019534_086320 [Acytostelium subglobosum LB1]|eukprot:XP_012751443.1 hypothetical protein SAMD00019534_086320 [Acytostelium subglobosum LB1]